MLGLGDIDFDSFLLLSGGSLSRNFYLRIVSADAIPFGSIQLRFDTIEDLPSYIPGTGLGLTPVTIVAIVDAFYAVSLKFFGVGASTLRMIGRLYIDRTLLFCTLKLPTEGS